MHWFWYKKGDGPQKISRIPKALERNKITVVILALLNTLPQASPSSYSVILDNLFTSIKLLTYFSQQGYGARGITRINGGIY